VFAIIILMLINNSLNADFSPTGPLTNKPKYDLVMNRPGKWWYVYIIRCADGTIYTGCTSNLKKRLERHNNGSVYYTKDKTPLKLISCFAFSDKYKAFFFEKYLKSGSGKAFLNKRLI